MKALVAANIDRGIIASGKTNRAIGEALGKTEHQVWRWRHGKHTPSLEVLAGLARELFDGDMTELYADDDDDKVAA